MPTAANLDTRILSLRDRVCQARAEVRELHDRGVSGGKVAARLTTAMDEAVAAVVRFVLDDLDAEMAATLRSRVVVAAHGGYGRRQLAPYSDIDVLLLHNFRNKGGFSEFQSRLLAALSDLAVPIGFLTYSLGEALDSARKEPETLTSLLECRPLIGNDELSTEFTARLAKTLRRRSGAYCQVVIAARAKERHQHGESVYLLEPNVKGSRGGLRDIQLLRWLGFLHYSATDPDALYRQGALAKLEHHRLRHAEEFLLRLRNEMHFHAGRANDVLHRSEQLRIAEAFGYREKAGLLPVQQLMREYFWNTSQVAMLARRFRAAVTPRSAAVQVLTPVFTHKVDELFRVGSRQISATRAGMDHIRTSLPAILRLVDLAGLYDRQIDPATWSAVQLAAPHLPEEASDEAIHRFLSLMAVPNRLGERLRLLHGLGVLERIIPAYKRIRCLLQFNFYHKYTVDEHCILAVESAAELDKGEGALAETYQNLKNKRLLHLALLLHDVGKGLDEDHSVAGTRIALETAERLKLPEVDRQTLARLIRHHLAMSDLAFFRNLADDEVIAQFAAKIGTVETLQMLYVLTCADLNAVGPGVLTKWKIDTLTHLLHVTRDYLATGVLPSSSTRRTTSRNNVLAKLDAEWQSDSWYQRQIERLPPDMLASQRPGELARLLMAWHDVAAGGIHAEGKYAGDGDSYEFLVAIPGGRGKGVFARLAGALSSFGLSIVSAHVDELADGLLLVRFSAADPLVHTQRREDREAELVTGVLERFESGQQPRFRPLWGEEELRRQQQLCAMPIRVEVDSRSSREHTIIEVIAFDRQGLLYRLARRIHELGLDIHVAKIGTVVDQVADVFYVTERDGRKVSGQERIEAIRSGVYEAVMLYEDA